MDLVLPLLLIVPLLLLLLVLPLLRHALLLLILLAVAVLRRLALFGLGLLLRFCRLLVSSSCCGSCAQT